MIRNSCCICKLRGHEWIFIFISHNRLIFNKKIYATKKSYEKSCQLSRFQWNILFFMLKIFSSNFELFNREHILLKSYFSSTRLWNLFIETSLHLRHKEAFLLNIYDYINWYNLAISDLSHILMKLTSCILIQLLSMFSYNNAETIK